MKVLLVQAGVVWGGGWEGGRIWLAAGLRQFEEPPGGFLGISAGIIFDATYMHHYRTHQHQPAFLYRL